VARLANQNMDSRARMQTPSIATNPWTIVMEFVAVLWAEGLRAGGRHPGDKSVDDRHGICRGVTKMGIGDPGDVYQD
jgi:hypothetical protein